MFKGYAKPSGYPYQESKFVPSCYNFSSVYSSGIEFFFLTIAIIGNIGLVVSIPLNFWGAISFFVVLSGGA